MADEKILNPNFAQTTEQNNTLEFLVDDGTVKVPIKNKFGEQIGLFSFHPADVGMLERYNRVAADFEKIVEPLDSAKTDKEFVEAMEEAKLRLYDACNYLLGGNFAEAFFGNMHPFSPVNGKFYCEQALEGLGQFISKQFDSEVKKINDRVNKYTGQYKPNVKSGKHKNGGKKRRRNH